MSTAQKRNAELEQLIAENPKEKAGMRGFFRVQVTEDGFGVTGDSEWIENQITNEGFRSMARLLGGLAGSSAITHAALGTGGVPASNATTLSGEVEVRAAVTAATSGSTALQLTATFASSASFVTNTQNVSNIGCFGTSTQGSTGLFAGNTYASSSVATNNNVNMTYTWTFA